LWIIGVQVNPVMKYTGKTLYIVVQGCVFLYWYILQSYIRNPYNWTLNVFCWRGKCYSKSICSSTALPFYFFIIWPETTMASSSFLQTFVMSILRGQTTTKTRLIRYILCKNNTSTLVVTWRKIATHFNITSYNKNIFLNCKTLSQEQRISI